MDEQNKNLNQTEPIPSGFDSVTNTTPNNGGQINPTPMFADVQNPAAPNTPKEGYTVTPEGGFYAPKPETAPAPKKAEPVAEVLEPASTELAQPEQQQPEVAIPASPMVEPESPTIPATTEPAHTVGAHDFIPNGTYSYSAAKGDLQSSAFETPDTKPPVTPPPQPVHHVYHAPPPPTPPKQTQKKEKRYGAGVVILAAILAAVIGMGGGVFGSLLLADKIPVKSPESSETASETAPQTVTNITVDETVNSKVEAVAKKAGPSIIGIRTTAAVTSFFGGSSEATEEGSGIIYSADGYIITNYHVIQSAVESSNSKVEVFLPDDTDTAITATVVGYNIASDLAVVKIKKTGLPAIEFANSDKLSVGQYAIAIGNPGGLEFIGSVSYGVISGLNRSVAVGTGGTMSLIQTDAAINPGNSGGALVDVSGKLIGVNSIKLVSESYEGMGFAIPSNTVKEICDNIIDKQNEPTPYIGIQISQSYSASQLKALGYPAGAVVVDVIEGGPASEGGIQRGDIITEFNGKAISNYTDLDGAISSCKPGDSVTVKLYRAGRFYSTNINVEANNAQ